MCNKRRNQPADSATKPLFCTKRLRVFRTTNKLSDQHATRDIFIAYISPEIDDWPFPVTVATVWRNMPLVQADYLEMIMTNPIQTGNGYATELILGLERFFGGELQMEAVTDEGRGLMRKLRRPSDE